MLLVITAGKKYCTSQLWNNGQQRLVALHVMWQLTCGIF